MSGSAFYVYEHWRPDKGVCFYVGKGVGNRAWKSGGRNTRHARVVAKLQRLGLTIDIRIVAYDLTEVAAHQIEIDRIAFWRGEGAHLVNMTDGGEGASGYRHSPEILAKMSEASKRAWEDPKRLEKHYESLQARMADPAFRARNSRARKELWEREEYRKKVTEGLKRSWMDPELRERQSLSRRGLKRAPEVGAKISAALTGTKKSEEACAKYSAWQQGRKLPPAHLEAVRAARKRDWENPEYREKVMEGRRRAQEKRKAESAE